MIVSSSGIDRPYLPVPDCRWTASSGLVGVDGTAPRNGDEVAKWISDDGHALPLAPPVNRPVRVDGAVVCNSLTTQSLRATVSGLSRNSCSALFVVRPHVLHAQVNSFNLLGQLGSAAAVGSVNGLIGVNSTFTTAGPGRIACERQAVLVTQSPAAYTFHINTPDRTGTVSRPNITATDTNFSLSFAGGQTFYGRYDEVCLWHSQRVDADAASILAAARDRWSIPAVRPTNRVVIFGDSIAVSRKSPLGLGFAQRLVLPSTHERFIYALAGTRSDQVLTAADSFGFAVCNGATVVIFLGTNDLIQGIAAATIKSNLTALVAGARNAGATRILLCTIPGRTAASPSVRDDVIAWILAGNAGHDDAPCIAADSLVGTLGTSPVYNTVDNVHYLDAGHQRIADIIQTALAI